MEHHPYGDRGNAQKQFRGHLYLKKGIHISRGRHVRREARTLTALEL